jgi:Fis family transcriptional regulator
VVRAKGGLIEASDVDAVLPTLARRVPMEEVSFEDLVRFKLSELLRMVDGYPVHALHEEVMGLVERPLLRLVLEHTGKNQVKAAEILGLSRNTLRRRLQDFGLVGPRGKMLRAKPGSRPAGARKIQKR